MQTKNFYIFRIAKGHDGGAPANHCPIDMYQYKDEIHKKLTNTNIQKIPYKTNNYIDYLHKELWQCGKLRQGWGLDGLDLRLFESDEKQWIENYIIGAKKNWGVEITQDYCHVAMGRYNILKNMIEAKQGDLIFIPKHSFENHHDHNHFTVCELVGNYYFDLNSNYCDFGHVVSVKNLKTFRYAEDTLLGKDFKGYRKALGHIQKGHELYDSERFREFLLRNYGVELDV